MSKIVSGFDAEDGSGTPRRDFLRTVALTPGLAAEGEQATPPAEAPKPVPLRVSPDPRVFRGAQLQMLAFPLGGVGAGSISLGGRGQLRDWEIFNRPDKGNSPTLRIPLDLGATGHAQDPSRRVLEARIAAAVRRVVSGLGRRTRPDCRGCDGAPSPANSRWRASTSTTPRSAGQGFARSVHPLRSRSKPTIPDFPWPCCATGFSNPAAAPGRRRIAFSFGQSRGHAGPR